jgi:hypothetical protein
MKDVKASTCSERENTWRHAGRTTAMSSRRRRPSPTANDGHHKSGRGCRAHWKVDASSMMTGSSTLLLALDLASSCFFFRCKSGGSRTPYTRCTCLAAILLVNRDDGSVLPSRVFFGRCNGRCCSLSMTELMEAMNCSIRWVDI